MLRNIIVPGAGGASIFLESLKLKGFDPVVPDWGYFSFREKFKDRIAGLPKQPCQAARDLAILKAISVSENLEFDGLYVVGFHSIGLFPEGPEIPNCRTQDDLYRTIMELSGMSFTYYVATAYGRVENGEFFSIGSGGKCAIGLSVKKMTSEEVKRLVSSIPDSEAEKASFGFRPLTNPHISRIIIHVRDSRNYFFDIIGRTIQDSLSG